jgi:hypothetical protein
MQLILVFIVLIVIMKLIDSLICNYYLKTRMADEPSTWSSQLLNKRKSKKLCGLSSRSNYADRVTDSCQQNLIIRQKYIHSNIHIPSGESYHDSTCILKETEDFKQQGNYNHNANF